MKHYYLLAIALVLAIGGYSQTAAFEYSTLFKLKNVPAAGILLNEGWKFQKGDDPAWATVGYNDNKWAAIDPSAHLYFLPQAQNTISWLRLNLKVGDDLKGKPISLWIEQFGASEVFLNGKKLYTFGKVSADADTETEYNPQSCPVILPLSENEEQVLAIRYSTHNPGIYYSTISCPLFQAKVFLPHNSESIYKDFINVDINQGIITGLFLMLSILHLFLYLSHRRKYINFYFALYALMQALSQLRGLFGLSKAHPGEQFVFYSLFYISAPLSGIFYLYAVYAFSRQAKSKWFYILITCCVAIVVMQFYPNERLRFLSLHIVMLLVLTESARIAYLGKKRSIRGAGLFFAGQLISVLAFLLFMLATFYSPMAGFTIFMYDAAFVLPPLIISFVLANDFGSTNRVLTQQLKDIEELSARNLAHEQEKQELLESQNEMLEQQVAERTSELNQSLTNLKLTQNQLIQSEKMASLGELTAGIAHEIQNPLNFVNNFSDVSVELLQELKEELGKGDIEEAIAIADDVSQNLEKISHHGKRADGIVKGMLQHSRASSGQKELIDINALADEYLRLAYHGLRAKDKSFNAELATHFDESLSKANIIPQDIGRVLLNLFTNAFYATQEKSKQSQSQFSGSKYKPTVTVTTRKNGNSAEISVKDNGTGIPDAIKDKILQPFFTTKPTGEGTGLGLSLSYDIIKGHGGSIDIESKEGVFSIFTITLPF